MPTTSQLTTEQLVALIDSGDNSLVPFLMHLAADVVEPVLRNVGGF